VTDAEPVPATAAPDSESCLCVVASYASVAELMESITTEAAARLMMSPSLGDFIELRFASLGTDPEDGSRDAAAVHRIIAELLRPRIGTGRSYFALLVVDRSAAVVEEVLAACAGSTYLAGLPLRQRGIASRPSRPDAPQPAAGADADIVVAPAGSWRRNDLVNELRRYGDDLLRQCAASQHPGLSEGEIAALRSRYEEDRTAAQPGPEPPTPEQRGPTESAPPTEPLPADALPAIMAVDVLEPPPEPPERPAETAEPTAGPATGAPPRAGWPRPWPRWRAELPRRRSDPGEPGAGAEVSEPEADGQRAEPGVSGIVYLLVTGETKVEDRAAWKRGRSALLDIDAKIATVPGAEFRVRVLHGNEQLRRGELRPAGQVTRRDLKDPVTHADFAVVLTEIRAMLDRDRLLTHPPGTAPGRPAVVFFAPDPPLADPAAARAFRDLAAGASILWIVPKAAAELIAAAFTEAPGTTFLTDNDAVAEEAAMLLAVAAGADAPMTGSHGG